jgi:hypothetical protein
MPWTRDGDGLKFVGSTHYEAGDIQALIENLRRARNQPGTICDLIEQLLSDGRASKDLIWRLSKWCDWNDPSERIARSMAEMLFHGTVCRRLLDQSNRPVPDRATADADYETWLTFVVNISNRLACPAIYPDEVDQNQVYFEGAVSERRVNVYERNALSITAPDVRFATSISRRHMMALGKASLSFTTCEALQKLAASMRWIPSQTYVRSAQTAISLSTVTNDPTASTK